VNKLVVTINSLNELGKCVSLDVTPENGFLIEGTELFDLHNTVKKENTSTQYAYGITFPIGDPKDWNLKDGREQGILIGRNYKGSIKLPVGTQRVILTELDDGRQIIKYEHMAHDGERYFLKTFQNEFRSADNRIDYDDFFPKKEQPKFNCCNHTW
jgi:hypothetical protein